MQSRRAGAGLDIEARCGLYQSQVGEVFEVVVAGLSPASARYPLRGLATLVGLQSNMLEVRTSSRVHYLLGVAVIDRIRVGRKTSAETSGVRLCFRGAGCPEGVWEQLAIETCVR